MERRWYRQLGEDTAFSTEGRRRDGAHYESAGKIQNSVLSYYTETQECLKRTRQMANITQRARGIPKDGPEMKQTTVRVRA